MKILSEGVVVEKTDQDFENDAVLNPACLYVNGITHVFYRAVQRGNFSTIGYCQLKDGNIIYRYDKPVIFPEYEYESHGVEDPRIVLLDDVYYLFYTAFDGKNAYPAYAVSMDLLEFEKKGLLFPKVTYREAVSYFDGNPALTRYVWYGNYLQDIHGQNVLMWDKDVFMFPRKINGKFMIVHRIMPGIQTISFDKFEDLTPEFVKDYLTNLDKHILLEQKYWFESRKIGGGCPPVETDEGWLLIYHGVEDSPGGRVYHAGAALLDLNDPTKVIARLPEPLFSPQEEWEKHGAVNNVVFPSSAIRDGDKLHIYYGAADNRIAVKTASLSEILDLLRNNLVK